MIAAQSTDSSPVRAPIDRLLASPEPALRYKMVVHRFGETPTAPLLRRLQAEIGVSSGRLR